MLPFTKWKMIALIPALFAVVAFSAYPVGIARASEDQVNYDDPNLAQSDGYVSGANLGCVQRASNGTGALESCVSPITVPASDNAKIVEATGSHPATR